MARRPARPAADQDVHAARKAGGQLQGTARVRVLQRLPADQLRAFRRTNAQRPGLEVPRAEDAPLSPRFPAQRDRGHPSELRLAMKRLLPIALLLVAACNTKV